MRLRHNPNAIPELNESRYLLSKYPIKLDENTTIELGMGKG